MKKLVSLLVVLLLMASLLSTTALAAYEAPVNLSSVYNVGDTVYTTEYYGTNGGITFFGNLSLSLLPNLALPKYEYVTSFAFYHDKFYLVAGEAGSDVLPAKIYSCDINGNHLTMIADNASNYSNVFIVDNVLYYDAYTTPSYFNNEYPGYYGGIYSINLYDLSWKKLSSDRNANIYYCDGDYIYYTIDYDEDKAYAIRTNGTGKMRINPYCDEYTHLTHIEEKGFLKGNQFYYLKNNHLYVRSRNGWDSRWVGVMPESDYYDIVSVTDDSVFCVRFVYGYNYTVNAELFRFNR